MLSRRGLIGSLLAAPAIVQLNNLMPLAHAPRYGALGFHPETGRVGWHPVSEHVMEVFRDCEWASMRVQLPRWNRVLGTGEFIIRHTEGHWTDPYGAQILSAASTLSVPIMPPQRMMSDLVRGQVLTSCALGGTLT